MTTIAKKMQSSADLQLQGAKSLLALRQEKDLLRFLTCGSVDDGKSTLIGRLLLETDSIYEDQYSLLISESAQHGTTDLPVDPALLLDGLEDERQQGITIDVAYRYFQTARRKFIIADSPGHEEYTRNMVTAASTADAAIILVDARKGLLQQTRRHSFIASLLGVKTLIVAVNKMDLVAYAESAFNEIRKDFEQFSKRLDGIDVQSLPLSGLCGDNVCKHSEKMPWYSGPTLLEMLEQAPLLSITQSEKCDGPSARAKDSNQDVLRFPVQRVVRPDSEFRGYSGRIASGSIRVGDRVIVLPSGQESGIRSIVTFDGDLERAEEGSAVTITLANEIDVTRGDMIVRGERVPEIGRQCKATVVWMSHEALVPSRSYWFKQAFRRTSAEVRCVAARIDLETLLPQQASSLRLNEIGRCELELHDPIILESYRNDRKSGAFILVDRVTHETVAAGILEDPDYDSLTDSVSHWDDALRSRRLHFTSSSITLEQRQELYGHAACTILLTGLSGAGKTTLAYMLEKRLFQAGFVVLVLDGQNLRHGISRELGFSVEERSENLRRAAEIARMVNDAGIVCIAAFVAPNCAIREKVRQLVGEDRLIHFHLSAPVEVCRERDRSGRYAAAERGEIVSFPGVTASYDVPDDADLVLQTGEWPIERCLDEIEAALQKRKITNIQSSYRRHV